MKLKIRTKSAQLLNNLWRRFAPSALICLLMTVTAIVYFSVYTLASSEVSNAVETPFAYVLSALGMGLLLATTISALSERFIWRKFIAWIAAAVGAGVGILLLHLSKIGIAMGSITGGIILSCLALCLHAVSLKDNPSLRLIMVFGCFCLAFAVSCVFAITLSICGSAIFALLAQNASSEAQSIYYSTSLSISFLLIAPWVFLGSLPDKDAQFDKRVNFLTYIMLLPLYLLFLGILLIYVAKIAITFTMPVGVMNSYGIGVLTLFVFFHLTMTGDENRLSAWFKKWGALLLVPIIVVQGIGVWMRVCAYGLTEARVLGLIWTAMCIAVVIAALFRRRANWFFLAAAAISIVIFCTPLSAENLAIMSQESRLNAALTRNGMLNEQDEIVAKSDVPLEDRKIIYSAIDYLEDADAREGSLTAQLHSQTEKLAEDSEYNRRSSYIRAQLLGFEEPENESSDWFTHHYYVYGGADTRQLDTRGYSYAELITVRQYAEGTENTFSVTHEAEDENRYGTTDVSALTTIIEANRGSSEPIMIDIPVTFMIDGEEIDIAPLITGAVFEEGSADMVSDTILLSSGKKLHFNQVYIVNYSSEDNSDLISFTAWLLTPDQE